MQICVSCGLIGELNLVEGTTDEFQCSDCSIPIQELVEDTADQLEQLEPTNQPEIKVDNTTSEKSFCGLCRIEMKPLEPTESVVFDGIKYSGHIECVECYKQHQEEENPVKALFEYKYAYGQADKIAIKIVGLFNAGKYKYMSQALTLIEFGGLRDGALVYRLVKEALSFIETNRD